MTTFQFLEIFMCHVKVLSFISSKGRPTYKSVLYCFISNFEQLYKFVICCRINGYAYVSLERLQMEELPNTLGELRSRGWIGCAYSVTNNACSDRHTLVQSTDGRQHAKAVRQGCPSYQFFHLPEDLHDTDGDCL